VVTEGVAAGASLEEMERQDARPDVDTATIIVHGLMGHTNGWSKGNNFQQSLTARGLNHDFYEFNWGGMSFDNRGGIPIKSMHTRWPLYISKWPKCLSG
jgi:hypothetical protein